MEYYSVIKEKETLPFSTTQMDLEGAMLSEIRQILHDLTYMWNLKKTKNKPINTKNRLVVAEVEHGRNG